MTPLRPPTFDTCALRRTLLATSKSACWPKRSDAMLGDGSQADPGEEKDVENVVIEQRVHTLRKEEKAISEIRTADG